MAEEEYQEEAPAGLPQWMATFADLMSLLMCFFVLLLSFSELEQKKYKQVAGSMNKAFGVQRDVPTMEVPKGTSIIAKEFSPGKPDPTAMAPLMQQKSTDQFKMNLDFTDSGMKGLDQQGGGFPDRLDTNAPNGRVDVHEDVVKAAQIIAKALDPEIKRGLLEVVALPERVAIRVRERGSFASGSAAIHRQFLPVLSKISQTLGEMDGAILVAGHTDDRPIATHRFPSNWELSAARAAAFVHDMTRRGAVQASRMEIRAHADTQPVAPNSSAMNRALNRRVEISLVVQETEVPAPQPIVIADHSPAADAPKL